MKINKSFPLFADAASQTGSKLQRAAAVQYMQLVQSKTTCMQSRRTIASALASPPRWSHSHFSPTPRRPSICQGLGWLCRCWTVAGVLYKCRTNQLLLLNCSVDRTRSVIGNLPRATLNGTTPLSPRPVPSSHPHHGQAHSLLALTGPAWPRVPLSSIIHSSLLDWKRKKGKGRRKTKRKRA